MYIYTIRYRGVIGIPIRLAFSTTREYINKVSALLFFSSEREMREKEEQFFFLFLHQRNTLNSRFSIHYKMLMRSSCVLACGFPHKLLPEGLPSTSWFSFLLLLLLLLGVCVRTVQAPATFIQVIPLRFTLHLKEKGGWRRLGRRGMKEEDKENDERG